MKIKNFIYGLLFISCLFYSCANEPIEKIIYVPTTDSISINEIIYLKEELRKTKDSLDYIRNDIGTDLFVANYKLGRIKYYNDIAAKGNNIKYLRGWINRVINE